MFEITGGLDYVPATMVAVVLSKWAADIFGKASLYVGRARGGGRSRPQDELIELYHYPHLDNKLDVVFHESAADVMDQNELCVIPTEGNTIASIRQLLRATRYSGFPVVWSTESMLICGYISRPRGAGRDSHLL